MENPTLTTPIADRIRRLFDSRRLFDQLALSQSTFGTQQWAGLERLQFEIYCLDSYFETNWQIDPCHLEHLWVKILRFVQVLAPGYDPEHLVSDIRQYQRLEEGLRVRNYALPSMPHYYWLKTCDVRLSRTIIELHSKKPGHNRRLQAWNYFDLLAELGDDLDDVAEDVDSFNGNRFLLAVGTLGADEAVDRSLVYISEVRTQFIRICDPSEDPGLAHVWHITQKESQRIETSLLRISRNCTELDKVWQRSSLGQLQRLGVMDATRCSEARLPLMRG